VTGAESLSTASGGRWAASETSTRGLAAPLMGLGAHPRTQNVNMALSVIEFAWAVIVICQSPAIWKYNGAIVKVPLPLGVIVGLTDDPCRIWGM
jgi:hypothetical protein